jgi:RHS repeat-associated protein
MKFSSTHLVLIVVLSAGVSSAQVSTGTPAFGSFGGGPFDTVNVGNLNVHFAIPVLNKAGRGIPFSYDLSYDSSIWTTVTVSGVTSWQPVFNWGWQSSFASHSGYITFRQSSGQCHDHTPFGLITNFAYRDPWGIDHTFPGTWRSGSSCTTPFSPFPISSTDGSGLTMIDQRTITTRGGTVLLPPVNPPNGTSGASTTITDANGNQITSNSTGAFTDTLNQTALTVAGAPPSPTTFTYTAPSGASAYTMNYTQYTVRTNFGVSGITGEYGPLSNPLVGSITMPDGTSYTFTYERTPGTCTPLSGTFTGYCITGRIASVTLPTGGSITYTYTGGTNGILSDGGAAGFTRTLNPGGAWTYARSGSGNTWTTTVTDPKTPGNQTVINYEKDSATSNPTTNLYETQRKIYQGPATGTPLRTTITCYNGQSVANPSACPTTAVATPILRVTSFRYLPDSTGVEAETDSTYDQFGLIHEVDDYDYGTVGSGTVGSLLRKTITSYVALGNGIVDRPSSVVIEDSGNNVKASTAYTYDDPGSLTTTSGIPQHISVTGSRGNLTSVAAQANTTTTLYRKFTYYDTGTLNTSTDVSTSSSSNGATTTYVYTSGTPSCNSAFPTSITEPLSLSRSMTWNCTGGVLLSLTDENGKQSSTSYTDPDFWRPHSTTDRAGNTTTYTYSPDANTSLPTQTESTLLFNSNNSVVDELTTVDGFGRVMLSQRKQGPSATNYDTTETDYDTAGCGGSRTTLPYSATQGQTNSSAPGTGINYDGACRTSSATDSGGGSTTSTYTYNDTYETRGPAPSGENAKRKQLEYNGLGQLKSVCEVTASIGSGSCGQSSGQTGYWTTYTFDTLGNQSGVTQNAQAAVPSQQTRSFVFDMLGRLTSETNPESNKTAAAYSYDSLSSDASCGTVTSAGNMLKTLDPAGNGACYAYDSLHRVTSVTYPSTSTPQKNFVYDTATVNSVSMVNAKTRLAEAYTCTGTCTSHTTDLGLSYSSLGQVTDVYEKTPNSAAFYHVTSQYWPSGSLNTLSGLPGLPTITYGATDGSGLDGEGRVTKVNAASGQNPVTTVTYNVASQATAMTLGSSDNDAFTFDPNTGRMTQYQFNMGSSPVKSDTGTPTWNPNGSLKQLAIVDQIYTSGTQTCNYSHDDLGRVATANCGTPWNQTFSYDAMGNISKTATVGISFNPSYDVTTNRITSSPFTYDTSNGNTNNGNLKTDNNHTYGWDTAGKMTSVDSGTANGVCLTYDALGRMVEQAKGSSCTTSYTQIVYAPAGGKLALMNGQTLTKAFVSLPSGGDAVYTSSGLAYYRHPDWLGSSRLATTPSRTMYYDTAYAPYGENYLGSGTMDLSFTGQNQDTVGGGTPGNLYDFLYRQHTSVQGRWLSPDPAGLRAVNPSNPQTWNRYAYVANNPLSFVDPLGLDLEAPCFFDDCGGGGGGGYCPPELENCDPGCDPFFGCDPWGGGGGGGGPLFGGGGGAAPPTPRKGGVWPDNETLGLPRGLNLHPATLADLLGLSPGTQCDFGVCTTLPAESLVSGSIAIGAEKIGERIITLADALGIALGLIVLQVGDTPPKGFEVCTYTSEYQDRSFDHQWKFCAYSCSSGRGATILWPVDQKCPETQKFPRW